jgi:hypothetical protein
VKGTRKSSRVFPKGEVLNGRYTSEMANEWNKTAFVEFETMLRRHLRRGAAPVAACAGFDLDAASSYLEGALGGPHLVSYESHLAGCAICRRHLIELARLAQTAPSFEAQPAAKPVRIPTWDRLKGAVAGWFDLSTWNLKWQIAGATGGAFAILIAALGAHSLYRASNQSAFVLSKASPGSQVAIAGRDDQPLPIPTPEPSTLDTLRSAEVSSDAIYSGPSRASVPTPDVPLKATAPDVSVRPPAEPLPLSDNQSSDAPVAPKPGGVAATEILPSQPKTVIQVNSRSDKSVLDSLRGEARESSAIETAQGPRNIPRYQPSLIGVGGGQEPRLKPTPERRPKLRILPEIKIWSLPEIARRALAPLSKSDSDTESERKARADKQAASNDATPNPMQIIIRDKIFCFEKCKGPDLEKIRGMWIDREYDFEKQKWNVWTLPRDSEAYKKVLADEPQLKEFFDHGPILIVWKNRVYKVLK